MYRLILGALAVALAAVLLAAGFAGGFLLARGYYEVPSLVSRVATDAAGGPAGALPDGDSSGLMSEVLHVLSQTFVEPVDTAKLERGAIDGMIEALDDPYTSYFDPEHYRFFKEQTTGEFYGVGIQIGERDKKITVISPIDGTPADKAGVKAGDIIVSVDGSKTAGKNVQIIAETIRGEEGTTVKLEIQRKGEKGTREFVLTRVKLELPNVSGKMIKGTDVGYVRVHSFSQDVAQDTQKKIAELKKDGAKGIIIDLRDNPGGLLQSGVDMASLFIDDGAIVTVKHRGGKTETLEAAGGADTDTPIVVLVNKGSASASEIFAGAMQDRGRAELVGEQTFGKAAVQTVQTLSNGAGLKVTTAFYLTPDGTNISKKGIKPDHVLKYVEAKDAEDPDSQIAKAIELLSR